MADIHERLYYASRDGNDTLVTELLAAGAEPDKYKDSHGHTALIEAAWGGKDSTVSILLQAKADVNIQSKYGNTALYSAAERGHNEVTTTLIKGGADLNRQNEYGNRNTALHYAAYHGHNEVTTTLIKAGAIIDLQDKDGDTALHCTTHDGHNEVTTTLIKAGADLNIQNNDGITALHCAAKWGYNEVTTTLIKAGADLYIQDNDGNTALAVAASGEVASTLMEAGTVPSFLVSRMARKHPSKISSMLDFLSKKLDKFEGGIDPDDYQKTKQTLGIETIKGNNKIMFYNVNFKNVDSKKSFLEYIDSQNVRLVRQREELIDLSVKIANLNHTRRKKDEVVVDTEKAMDEVIKQYKSGLPSGIGLREMIDQIKERYPWSSSKKIIMIFVSLVTCLLGIGLFVFDLTTDVKFSLEMLKNGETRDESTETEDFESFHSEHFGKNFSSPESLQPACDAFMDFYENYTRNSSILNNQDYVLTGWISIWHCIQPFIITLIVFLSMKSCKGGKCSALEEPRYLRDKKWWCFSSVLCCLPSLGYIGSLVPLPGLTHLYRFYLDVRSHIVRSKSDFKYNMEDIEEEIREHEALGEFLKSSENYIILIILCQIYNIV